MTYAAIGLMLCPSDGVGDRPRAPFAPGNYMGNFGGPGPLRIASGTIIPARDRAPTSTLATLGDPYGGWGSAVTIAAIRDGTSNTALFSERLLGTTMSPMLRSSPEARRAVFNGTASAPRNATVEQALAFWRSCRSLPGTTQTIWTQRSGQVWAAGYPLHMVNNVYHHYGTPNDVPCQNPGDPNHSWLTYVGPMGSAPPSSNHPGGVNVSFADGSVRFIKDTINPETWWALGTRAGGEVVSADQF